MWLERIGRAMGDVRVSWQTEGASSLSVASTNASTNPLQAAAHLPLSRYTDVEEEDDVDVGSG